MIKKLTILLFAILLPLLVLNLFAEEKHDNKQAEEKDPHANCDHAKHDDDKHDEADVHNDHDNDAGHAEADNHEGHDHGEAEDHDNLGEVDNHEGHDHGNAGDHSDEIIVSLTPNAIELAGIEFSKINYGYIESSIELPGEIGFNEDRLAHIAPRFAGIALKANYRVGDYVKEGNVVAVVESNESMNSYSIKAPISGWVIERHITQGEYVSEENTIFTIADLSTVWVNLAVYPKDADRITKGQTAIINSIGKSNITTGVIEYITPIMDIRTRSATARIILKNNGTTWRPGTFVQATIKTASDEKTLVVEKNAVQYLEDKSVVFVVDELNKYKPVEIETGESDANYIQIISGLEEGRSYVSSGAFELKAKLVTSNLDAHAGHGH